MYRSWSPTSPLTIVYVFAFWPEIDVQVPFFAHRSHWYEKVIGVVPAQFPSLAVRVCPTCAVPLGLGWPVAAGALPDFATTPVCPEKTEPLPALFDAVTFTRT